MFLSSTWRHLLQTRRIGRASRRGPRRPLANRFFRWLRVEQLEDRLAPATFQWVGGAGPLNWAVAANWTGGPAGAFPNAPGDIAQFTGTYATAQAVTVNQAI